MSLKYSLEFIELHQIRLLIYLIYGLFFLIPCSYQGKILVGSNTRAQYVFIAAYHVVVQLFLFRIVGK